MTTTERKKLVKKIALTEEEYKTVGDMMKKMADYCLDHNIRLIVDGGGPRMYAFKAEEFYVGENDEEDLNPECDLAEISPHPIATAIDSEAFNDTIHIVK